MRNIQIPDPDKTVWYDLQSFGNFNLALQSLDDESACHHFRLRYIELPSRLVQQIFSLH